MPEPLTHSYDIKCPDCGGKMVLRETAKFKYDSGDKRKFYGCTNWPCCKATHGAHPDGRPLGFPADTETKQLRIQCHALIKELEMDMKTGEIYRALKERLGHDDIHFGNFSKEQCLESLLILNSLKREANA